MGAGITAHFARARRSAPRPRAHSASTRGGTADDARGRFVCVLAPAAAVRAIDELPRASGALCVVETFRASGRDAPAGRGDDLFPGSKVTAGWQEAGKEACWNRTASLPYERMYRARFRPGGRR